MLKKKKLLCLSDESEGLKRVKRLNGMLDKQRRTKEVASILNLGVDINP